MKTPLQIAEEIQHEHEKWFETPKNNPQEQQYHVAALETAKLICDRIRQSAAQD